MLGWVTSTYAITKNDIELKSLFTVYSRHEHDDFIAISTFVSFKRSSV